MELPDDGAPLPPPPAKPPGRVKVFACPNCGGAVTLRAVGQSVTAKCSHCSSLIDVANENYRIIAEAQARAWTAAIEIGKRGKLNGIDWEVIGFQERCDETKTFVWTEYLLFNPYYGYRFLICESGHWTLAKMLNREIAGVGTLETVSFEGRSYKRFSEGKSYTQRVGGEFYWRASTDDVSDGVDYVAPPYRLFGERNNDEIIVSHGEYLSAQVVAAAFGDGVYGAGGPSSVGANQPNPYAAARSKLLPAAIIAVIAATLVQFAGVFTSDNAQVSASTLSFTAADKEKPVVGPSFTLATDGNLVIDTASQLDNNWLELDLSLVNEQTGQTYDVTQGMEYYSGYDSDGAWTEGDNTSSVTFPHVPAGSYKLLVGPDAGSFATTPASTTPTTVMVMKNVDGMSIPTFVPAPPPPAPPPILAQIKIRHGVMNWSNYLIALVLLILFPLYALGRYWWFESTRWSDSGSASESSSGGSDEE